MPAVLTHDDGVVITIVRVVMTPSAVMVAVDINADADARRTGADIDILSDRGRSNRCARESQNSDCNVPHLEASSSVPGCNVAVDRSFRQRRGRACN